MPDYTIPNLKNACLILEHLANSSTPLTNTQIAEELKLPRSTVLRILWTLEGQNFIRKEDKLNMLGSALIHLGNRTIQKLSIRDIAPPLLSKITEYTQETSQLAMLSNNKVLILEVCVSPHPLSAHSNQGTLADIHCSASGKTLLAYQPEDKVDSILEEIQFEARTLKTIQSANNLKQELEQIKECGYSIDEEEYHEGIRCLAVPVFDVNENAKYAIGITASTSRFRKTHIKKYSAYLQQQSNQLSKALGLRK